MVNQLNFCFATKLQTIIFANCQTETNEYEDQLGRFRNYHFACLRCTLCVAATIPLLTAIIWSEYYR